MEKKRLLQTFARCQNSCLTRSDLNWPRGSLFYQNTKISSNNFQREISSTAIFFGRGFLKFKRTAKNPKISEAANLFLNNNDSTSLSNEFEESAAAPNSWINPVSPRRDKSDIELKRLLGTWVEPQPQKPFPFSRHPSRNSSTTPIEKNQYKYNLSQLLDFARPKTSNVDWKELAKQVEKPTNETDSSDKIFNMSISKVKTARQPINFSPSSGREVFISQKTNLIKAFRLVEITCSRNRVRREASMQRFHERPGLKRKRLKSQRWRERFLEGFKATVNRVQDLTRQGW
ncbi:hypothetical protein HI914_06963 [Erysiphe necator]|nr:hypothetical protein HI914_06963 [Erysiphe necator]